MSTTTPSSTDSVTIYIDGASRGNPGPSGIGAVFLDAQGRTVLKVSKHLGVTTNNVAEYLALIYALHEARRRGFARVTVRTDSELLARQIDGRYKVRNGVLRLLYDLARLVLPDFTVFSIEHVARERNTHADRLAGQAADASTDASLNVVPS